MADIKMDDVNIEIQSSSDKATQGVDSLIQTLNNLNSSLGGIQKNTNRYIQNMKQISDISKKVKTPKVSNNIKSPNVAKEIEFLNSNLPDGGKKLIDDDNADESVESIKELKTALESLQKTANKTSNRISDMFKNIRNSKIVRAGIKGLDNAFGGLGQRMVDTRNRMTSMIKTFSKYALALYGIRSAFYAVRNVSNEFLSSQNATARQLSANISYLKYSLGSLLAPVITFITNLIYSLLKAMQYLVYFFARINIFSGLTAKNFASTAGSAGKTTKELQKQLQSFDELNNINLEQNSGSGGGGGAGDIAPNIDLSEIDTSFKYLFDDIENWGRKLAEKINDFLYGINWTPVLEGAERVATLLAKILNDFTYYLDFKEVGNAIAQGLNTAIIFVNTFFQKYDWKELGIQLANGLNSMINNLKWEELGQLLTDKFRALILSLEGFVTTFNWAEFGMSVGRMAMSAFENIPWDSLANGINEGIIGILDAFINFLDTVQWDEVGKTIGKFLNSIDWKEIFTKLFKAIGEIAKGVIEVLWNTIFSGEKTTALAGIIVGFLTLKTSISGLLTITKVTLEFSKFFNVAGGGMSGLLPIIGKGGIVLITAIKQVTTTIIGIIATIKGVELTFTNLFDILQNGANKANVALTILGVAITSIGVIMASVVFGPIPAFVALMYGLVKAFTKTTDEIKDLNKAQQDFNNALEDAIQKQEMYENAVDMASSTLERLEEAEKATGLSGESLFKQVQEGTLTYAQMTQEQREVYKAYKANEQAQYELTVAEQQYNEAKKEQIRQSFETQLSMAKESQSYDNLKKSIMEAYQDEAISAEEARDLIERSMADMSDDARQAFLEDIPGDITDGLDPNRYASATRKFTDWFGGIWDGLKDTIGNWWNTYVAPWFTAEKWQKLADDAKNAVTNKFNEWKQKFQPIKDWWNTHIAPWFTREKWQGLAQKAVDGIKNAFSGLNIHIKLPHFSWSQQAVGGTVGNILKALNLPATLPKLKIDWYAEGGYPTEGDLFFANEAGPEMVGTIGNKNAVANNDQIERAIANATYEAVSRALYENQDSNQPIIVNVGNETLYKGMTRSRSQASNQYGITV